MNMTTDKALEKHRKRIERLRHKTRNSGGMIDYPSTVGTIVDILIVLFMLFIIFICIVPIWHVLMSSLSDGKTLLSRGGLILWPLKNFNLQGYALLFKNLNILRGYLNTIIYVILGTAFGFFINVIGGYVLSRDSLYRKPLLVIIFFTVLFNGGLIPTYLVIRSLGMVGTIWALVIPGCTNAIYLIILATSFRTVAKETIEAAELDGAGHLTVMFNVVLPQAFSMAAVTILFSVVQQWNSWFPASIYVPSQQKLWPIQLWIRQIVAENQNFLMASNPDYNRYLIQYAVIIIATIPILIAFPFFLKHIEKGIALGGVKG